MFQKELIFFVAPGIPSCISKRIDFWHIFFLDLQAVMIILKKTSWFYLGVYAITIKTVSVGNVFLSENNRQTFRIQRGEVGCCLTPSPWGGAAETAAYTWGQSLEGHMRSEFWVNEIICWESESRFQNLTITRTSHEIIIKNQQLKKSANVEPKNNTQQSIKTKTKKNERKKTHKKQNQTKQNKTKLWPW